MQSPRIIGYKESVSFPLWGIFHLSAKSDTGAKNSAIDVTNIRELDDNRLYFEVIMDRGDRERVHPVESEIAGVSRVPSSNGQIQTRYRVRTTVKVGDFDKEAIFTLVSRKRMIHRVLLGRSFLSTDFLVDSGKRFIHSQRKKPSSKEPKA